MQLNQGTLIAERYEIKEQIGLGGMAIVYLALDTKLNRPVSFKVLKEEHLGDDFVFSKFSTEAKAVAMLSNQNVVSVYDVGMEDNIHYIVMEYIDGVTLKELIGQRAPFKNDEAIGVAIQIGQALSHAHANKVVHQDIKPQNILITHEGVVKVTDFGIASAQAVTTDTTTTSTVGSVHYFSPEQARGRFVDHRSDIYSLGIVLYEMVTGKLPFEGDNQVNIALSHINEELPELPEHVSGSLESIIIKATKKLSNQRYSHVDDMVEDLKLALTTEVPLPNQDDYLSQHTVILSDNDQQAINAQAIAVTDETPEQDTHTLTPQGKVRRGSNRQAPSFDIFDPKAAEAPNINKRLEKKIMLIGAATAVVIALIISIIMLLALNSNSDAAPNTPVVTADTVPELIGLAWNEGRDILTALGLDVAYIPAYSDTVLIDLIVDQVPVAGTPIDSELTEVAITISRGPFSYEVPNLVGETWVVAQTLLDSVPQIQLIHTTSPSDEPFSTIIAQTPEPGVSLGIDGIIEVVVSSGSENATAAVPNLVGLTETAAVAMLQQQELTASISRVHHDDILSGNVISQGTAPGTTLSVGNVVGLTVSLGQAPGQEPVPATTDIADTEPETAVPVEDTADEPVSETPATDTQEATPPPPPQVSEEAAYMIQHVLFNLPGDFDFFNNPNVHAVAVINQQVIFETTAPATSFPIAVPVERPQGSGSVVVQFWVFSQLISQETLTF